MIKKTFSKTFYALFFSTFLMINAGDALAAGSANADDTVATTITSATTCSDASICNNGTAVGNDWAIATACPNEATITLKASTGGITRSFYKCNGSTALTAAEIQKICLSNCEYIKSKISGNVADEAYNISQNTFTKSMCNALRVVTGSAGKTFAAFAIIATGIGFFTGKVSWGLMIGVTAGIATMFGAPSIVAAISGQDLKTSCKIN
jgi:type IV secretory pathway VirB2 component (pilin)